VRSIVVRTSAKVNFCLRVLGKRADGCHDVQTVLHTIGLWDRLHLSPIAEESRITLEINTTDVPADESNLCWRAAQLLMQRAKASPGVAIALEKSIPVEAGLGGGSSDAAATLKGLAAMLDIEGGNELLEEVAPELGADVPFFLRGGCCLAEGRGERLRALPEMAAWLVLAVPERRVPTAQAYAALRRGTARGRRRALARAVQRAVKAVEERDLERLAGALHNDFEAVAMSGISDALRARDEMLQIGCLGACLSGTGSAVFGLSPSEEEARRIAARLGEQWSWVEVVPTVPAGSSLLIEGVEEAPGS
jgi:4-diphosphocytidyl-2-C-methyl-D-erythritol kinase